MQRLKKFLVISLMLSIMFLVLLTAFTVGPETLPALREMKPLYLFAAMALHIGSYVIWGMRLKVMAWGLGHHISIRDATEAVVSNLFAASITPSMAGGEPVRIHLLNRSGNIPIGDASAVVIAERVLDALLLLVATPCALWVLRASLVNWELDAAIAVAEIFVLFMVVLTIAGLLNPKFITWILALVTRGLHRIVRFDRTEHIIEFIDRELWNFHNGLWKFVRTGQRGLVLGGLLTVVFWFVEFLIVPLILLGLNQPPHLLTAFAVQVFLTLVMVVPITPGASGIAEMGGAALFGILVPVSILGIVVTIWRLITYYLNIVLGGLVSVKILKNGDLLRD
ncbi:MAG: flippase-like domain-containing protein [ANME-2 cluster archaeon]|nr:flippase-like domain-containing protein [ANME-2 cluster archaeon]